MPKYEVLERESSNMPWLPVRSDHVVSRYETQEAAMTAAKRYVSERNVENALAASEKESAADVFLMDENGCYLGNLDGDDWYMLYKKDTNSKTGSLLYKKGEVVKDAHYFELDKKGEVCVKQVPKT